jgi:hypothetical protein
MSKDPRYYLPKEGFASYSTASERDCVVKVHDVLDRMLKNCSLGTPTVGHKGNRHSHLVAQYSQATARSSMANILENSAHSVLAGLLPE